MSNSLLEAQVDAYNRLHEAASGLVIEFDYIHGTTSVSEDEEVELERALREVAFLYGEESVCETPLYPEEINVLCMIAVHKQCSQRIKIAEYPDGENFND